MAVEYDLMADQYDLTFQALPFRLHIEAFSIFQTLDNVTDQAVLDLACGTGFYSRELCRRGAARVVGVDISEEMIRVAQMAEESGVAGIHYLVHDVTTLPVLGQFDTVLGVYLLHYATNFEQLQQMCHGIARNLRSGQRCVMYQLNPDMACEPDYYLNYGMDLHITSELSDGDAFTFAVMINGNKSPNLTVHYWSRRVLEAALHEAGFAQVEWIMPQVSQAGIDKYGPSFWQDYLDRPHCMIVSCVKQ
jgi:ubiquinone/menaquinone biosynthesis C-methylase UbiE